MHDEMREAHGRQRKSESVPSVAFLGVCERGSEVATDSPLFAAMHIIGLKNVVASFLFPYILDGTRFVFSIYEPEHFESAQVNFVLEDGSVLFSLRLQHQGVTEVKATAPVPHGHRSVIFLETPSWVTFLYPIDQQLAVVPKPCTLRAILVEDNREVCIGALSFVGVDAMPLTPDRVQAIRSDPLAMKIVRFGIACKECSKECRAYAALEKHARLESEGWKWYEELPEQFVCTCGKTTVDLQFVRRNLHGVLSAGTHRVGELTVSRLYEKDTLQEIVRAFGRLLDGEAREEAIHQFIKDNPILLNQCSPSRILHKVPVLTRFKTDIALLDQRGVLRLIELERPDLALMKKDGGVSASLQHAFDQVRSWLARIRRDWSATLQEMKFKPDEVARVDGVVIAGRDKEYSAEQLVELKGHDFGEIQFYTYDDLLNGLVETVRTMEAL